MLDCGWNEKYGTRVNGTCVCRNEWHNDDFFIEYNNCAVPYLFDELISLFWMFLCFFLIVVIRNRAPIKLIGPFIITIFLCISIILNIRFDIVEQFRYIATHTFRAFQFVFNLLYFTSIIYQCNTLIRDNPAAKEKRRNANIKRMNILFGGVLILLTIVIMMLTFFQNVVPEFTIPSFLTIAVFIEFIYILSIVLSTVHEFIISTPQLRSVELLSWFCYLIRFVGLALTAGFALSEQSIKPIFILYSLTNTTSLIQLYCVYNFIFLN